MCGRYTLRTPAKELVKVFGLAELPLFEPRYNIAPSQDAAAVRVKPGDSGREWAYLRWGLVAPWSKDPKKGPAPINARAESVARNALFRTPFRNRRCLIVADGYYEWKKLPERKQPYYLRLRDGGPFALAGLWQRWEAGDEAIESCTILTTTANEVSGAIHDRMPVILHASDYATWLDPELHDAAKLEPLLRPYDAGVMVAEPVSTRVNNPRNEGADLIVPLLEAD